MNTNFKKMISEVYKESFCLKNIKNILYTIKCKNLKFDEMHRYITNSIRYKAKALVIILAVITGCGSNDYDNLEENQGNIATLDSEENIESENGIKNLQNNTSSMTESGVCGKKGKQLNSVTNEGDEKPSEISSVIIDKNANIKKDEENTNGSESGSVTITTPSPLNDKNNLDDETDQNEVSFDIPEDVNRVNNQSLSIMANELVRQSVKKKKQDEIDDIGTGPANENNNNNSSEVNNQNIILEEKGVNNNQATTYTRAPTAIIKPGSGSCTNIDQHSLNQNQQNIDKNSQNHEISNQGSKPSIPNQNNLNRSGIRSNRSQLGLLNNNRNSGTHREINGNISKNSDINRNENQQQKPNTSQLNSEENNEVTYPVLSKKNRKKAKINQNIQSDTEEKEKGKDKLDELGKVVNIYNDIEKYTTRPKRSRRERKKLYEPILDIFYKLVGSIKQNYKNLSTILDKEIIEDLAYISKEIVKIDMGDPSKLYNIRPIWITNTVYFIYNILSQDNISPRLGKDIRNIAYNFRQAQKSNTNLIEEINTIPEYVERFKKSNLNVQTKNTLKYIGIYKKLLIMCLTSYFTLAFVKKCKLEQYYSSLSACTKKLNELLIEDTQHFDSLLKNKNKLKSDIDNILFLSRLVSTTIKKDSFIKKHVKNKKGFLSLFKRKKTNTAKQIDRDSDSVLDDENVELGDNLKNKELLESNNTSNNLK